MDSSLCVVLCRTQYVVKRLRCAPYVYGRLRLAVTCCAPCVYGRLLLAVTRCVPSVFL
jgi:hypothetical protein